MSFAHYLLQVNLYLIVFYGFYRLLLDRETYFTLNRIYLISAGLLSLCIPFIRLEWLTEQKAAQQVYTTVNWEAVLERATIVTTGSTGFNWASAFVYMYCAGILFFLARLVYNLFAVKKLINLNKAGAAFAFFGKKIVDRELPQMEVIDIHEEAHIKQWHTVDILFFELIGIITWLNPVIYLYKKTIKNIHEFLADELAAEFQGDKAEYALLLLSKSFGISPNALTNGFMEKSLIKKRIFMLHKERSKKTAIMKYGIFIPLFALFIVFSSATVRKNEKLIAITDQIPMEKPIEMVQDIVTDTPEDSVATSVSVDGRTDVNWKGFYQFMAKNIKYPENASSNEIQGNTLTRFELKGGKIVNISSKEVLGGGCEEEVIRAISAFKGFKKITDGKYELNVGFNMPDAKEKFKNRFIKTSAEYADLNKLNIVSYAAKTSETENKSNLSQDDTDKKIYDFVSIDKQPEYPGGIAKFYQYLGGSIKYPKTALDNNVQGKVFLSFIVEKDGTLTDVQITRGLGSGTDEEALRVIKESPKWNPGLANGAPVRVKYNINVNFTINDDKPRENKPGNAMPVQIKLKGSALNSEPLVIMDGVKMPDNTLLSNINANNIESISVLKDQTAMSIYGPRAKDGVILITTKTKNSLLRGLSTKESTNDKNVDILDIKRKF